MFACVVQLADRCHVEGVVADPIGQRFTVAWYMPDVSKWTLVYEVGDAFAFHRFPVNVKNAVNHLNRIAGQSDDTFDVVCGRISGPFENCNVATFRL